MIEVSTVHLKFDRIRDYFAMSYFERLLVRAVFSTLFVSAVILGGILLNDSSTSLRLAGFLLLVFLLDMAAAFLFGEHWITPEIISNPAAHNPFKLLTRKAFILLDSAFSKSQFEARTFSLCLFYSLLKDGEIKKGIQKLGVDPNDLLKSLANIEAQDKQDPDIAANQSALQRQELEQVVSGAFVEALELKERSISSASLFLGLLRVKNPQLVKFISQFNLNSEDFRNAIIFGRLAKGLGRQMQKKRASAAGKLARSHRIVNRAWTSRPTPYLDSVSEDLTDKARQLQIGFLVGHLDSYRQAVNVLSREGRNNALLVGEEEIGKTTIVEHLAYNLVKDNVPDKLFDKRLASLDLARITAGAQTAGEVQERFRKLINEVLRAGNIVLFIPDIHNLKLTVNQEELGGFEILEPVFSAALIPVIGTTTQKLYRSIIEINQKFKENFEIIKVEELTPSETIQLLIYESFNLETKWKITITYPALKRVVELANRYLHAKPLPRASLDLLQECLIEAKQQGQDTLIPQLVVNIVSKKTRIPIEMATGKEAEILLNLEDKIHEKLINQEAAVKAVASSLRQYRTGLARQKGPIASFLFVGPTGVGKTELSKVLAELYFGSEDRMIRFDMSEYQDEKSIWSFLGSPDGSLSGALTEAVKHNPFALILLDEFEKAHPNLLDIFLPVFDEGEVSDNLGEKVDFKNTIITCTSNAHSNYIKEQIEKGRTVPDFQVELKNKLTEYFKPELLNRFDNVIAFRQLTLEEIKKIVQLQLIGLQKQILQAQGIRLEFSEEAYGLLAELGYDPVFGARPLRGVISMQLKDQLARKILKGELSQGETVRVSVEQGALVFKK